MGSYIEATTEAAIMALLLATVTSLTAAGLLHHCCGILRTIKIWKV